MICCISYYRVTSKYIVNGVFRQYFKLLDLSKDLASDHACLRYDMSSVSNVCLPSSMWSHQSADVSLTVPFDAIHLILVLLVGRAEIYCFGFIGLQSICMRLLSLLPGCLMLLNLKKKTTYTQ